MWARDVSEILIVCQLPVSRYLAAIAIIILGCGAPCEETIKWKLQLGRNVANAARVILYLFLTMVRKGPQCPIKPGFVRTPPVGSI